MRLLNVGEIMTKCWFCRAEMIWQNDFSYEDWGFHGDGMVAVLRCSECGAEARFLEGDEQ